jgi:hypothetical protein
MSVIRGHKKSGQDAVKLENPGEMQPEQKSPALIWSDPAKRDSLAIMVSVRTVLYWWKDLPPERRSASWTAGIPVALESVRSRTKEACPLADMRKRTHWAVDWPHRISLQEARHIWRCERTLISWPARDIAKVSFSRKGFLNFYSNSAFTDPSGGAFFYGLIS